MSKAAPSSHLDDFLAFCRKWSNTPPHNMSLGGVDPDWANKGKDEGIDDDEVYCPPAAMVFARHNDDYLVGALWYGWDYPPGDKKSVSIDSLPRTWYRINKKMEEIGEFTTIKQKEPGYGGFIELEEHIKEAGKWGKECITTFPSLTAWQDYVLAQGPIARFNFDEYQDRLRFGDDKRPDSDDEEYWEQESYGERVVLLEMIPEWLFSTEANPIKQQPSSEASNSSSTDDASESFAFIKRQHLVDFKAGRITSKQYNELLLDLATTSGAKKRKL